MKNTLDHAFIIAAYEVASDSNKDGFFKALKSALQARPDLAPLVLSVAQSAIKMDIARDDWVWETCGLVNSVFFQGRNPELADAELLKDLARVTLKWDDLWSTTNDTCEYILEKRPELAGTLASAAQEFFGDGSGYADVPQHTRLALQQILLSSLRYQKGKDVAAQALPMAKAAMLDPDADVRQLGLDNAYLAILADEKLATEPLLGLIASLQHDGDEKVEEFASETCELIAEQYPHLKKSLQPNNRSSLHHITWRLNRIAAGGRKAAQPSS